MNAESYLRKQGWKGSGHSLDSTGRGIKKPLLIAHKQDQLGLGKKKAAWTTDDQWWMRAYDQSLQSIGTGTGQDSTLNQIRTKGINRGGLYGFFVKGEAIAGTIDDTSANTTDASIPPSGASTPPTSASESEAPAKATKISDKKNKRRREADDAPQEVKKAKKANMKREKTAQKASATTTNSAQGQSATARKIAKLSPKKKAWYEQRAAVKNQTIEEYISRRVEKKSAKKSAKRATTRLDDSAAAPAPFFTDLEGDVTLLQPATPALPAQPILGVVKNAPADEATVPPVADAASPVPDTAAPKKAKKVRKAHLPSDKPSGKKAYLNMTREKRKVKKDEKKAFKAEKAATKSNSKWGNNKADSRWGKIKAAKQAEKGE